MTTMKRLFSQGFRIFFLSACLFAILSMLIWEGYLAILATDRIVDLPFGVAPHLWHAHEMIFGYGSAALAGFLLTAVPSWTGAKSAPHRFIAVVAGLWLAIRNMPGQEVIKPGLVCMSFGFMFRMLGPAPTRHRQDREP